MKNKNKNKSRRRELNAKSVIELARKYQRLEDDLGDLLLYIMKKKEGKLNLGIESEHYYFSMIYKTLENCSIIEDDKEEE